jgi:ABC-type multidrug transport system ATPase subunit
VSPPPASHTDALDFPFVAVSDVSRAFGRRRALSRVSLRVDQGQILGILGPNGAGKSTLLAILATLLRPTSGDVRYGALTATDGAALRARIGVLGHDLFLYPELTARENLEFFASAHGLPHPAEAARTALTRAALDERADDPVSAFSRGMRQRVALERALIHGPRLVLLDDGAMVIVATHDLDLADGLLDHALFLRDGRVAASMARPERLRSTYQNVMTRALGSAP